MTHEQINVKAYDEARRAFIDQLLQQGRSLEYATQSRKLIFESSRLCRCTKCEIEKHVSEFYQEANRHGPQAWCKACQIRVHRERNEERKALLAQGG
jgi:hypothetical protein